MILKVLYFFKLLFAAFSFICLFYSVMEFTYFISFPKEETGKTHEEIWFEGSWVLLKDMALLVLFIVQHSAMASERFKSCLSKFKLDDMSRCIYTTATAASLLFIMKSWLTSTIVLWHLNLSYKPLSWIYFGVHSVAWIIIYVANICTDVTELLGLKQIYYSIINLPEPNQRKSHRLRKLTSHMRHPSFLGFLMVFWFYPTMTLDRLLLGTILTLYMYIAWNTDGEDYNYQKYMYQRKYHELERLHTY
ncbi:nurim homolog [Sitophilus oryzae]|uniref:Nuclear envelope membrane protein n=1 Tax=Sitophilus oryzae TaxID=7048 RepID=A0A6J2XY66_SITOR|nr:nurim homolog [Sitophilus oryzae]